MNELNILVKAKHLSDLVLGLGVYSQDVKVTNICDDTRKLQAGDTFLCLLRTPKSMIECAIDKGANAVIVIGEFNEKMSIPCACLPDMDTAGKMLRKWFETENVAVKCIGITGTDGKTSTAWMLRETLENCLDSAWSVGTLGWVQNKNIMVDLGNTTPSLMNNHKLLCKAHQKRVKALVYEVSSHGIDQARIAGISFDAAIWTTMGHDHLEDHGSYEVYLNIKKRFIQAVASAGGVVIANADYAEITNALGNIKKSVMWYSAKNTESMQWSAHNDIVSLTNNEHNIHLPNAPYADFHAENLAAVSLAVMSLLGYSLNEFQKCANDLSTPVGRLEPVSEQIYIDYAHTAEGLQRCLSSARKLTPTQLLLVFGCGGNRDKSKRPQMGAVAEEFADKCWLTSDNPRDERQSDIANGVLSGLRQPEVMHVVEDRAVAISQAIAALLPQDVLVIAGKGHETYMEIKGKRLPWSDKNEAFKALAAHEVQPCV